MNKTQQYPLKTFLFFAILLLYVPSLFVPFYLDDFSSIVTNSQVTADWFSYIKQYSRRALTYSTFWLDYQLWQTNPVGYHFGNMLIHASNAVLLFIFLKKLKLSPNQYLVLLIALFWALHPLNSQSVIYIVQRGVLIATCFILLSLISWLNFKNNDDHKFKWLLSACLCFFTACLSKEFALVTPLLWILIEVFHRPEFFVKRKKQCVKALALLLCTVLFSGYFGLLDTIDTLSRETTEFTRWEYFLIQQKVVAIYQYKFFIPFPLLLEYPNFPKVTLQQALPFLFIHFIALSLAILFYRKKSLFSFGILFYYVTSLIESGVIPITDLAFEHRTYFSNVGLVILVYALLAMLAERYIPFRKIVLLMLIPIFVFSGLTIHRQLQWQEPLNFYLSNAKHSSSNVRLNYNIALEFVKKDDFVNAVQYFEKAFHLAESQQKIVYPLVNEYMKSLIISNRMPEAAELMERHFDSFSSKPVEQSGLLATFSQIFLIRNDCKTALLYLNQALYLDKENAIALESKRECRID